MFLRAEIQQKLIKISELADFLFLIKQLLSRNWSILLKGRMWLRDCETTLVYSEIFIVSYA